MIKIGGKKRPVRFGFNAFIEFEKQAGIPMMQMKFESMVEIRAMVYAGLLHGAKYEGQEIDFTIEDVGDWLGEGMGVVSEFVELATESIPKPGK